MSNSDLLQPAPLWAEQELGSVPIGDRRRTKRLVTVTTALAQNPNGTLPSTFLEWTQLRAAYRLFAEPDVTHDAILAPHAQRLAQACQSPGQYLLVEDTTTLSFNTHLAATDLGPVNDQGGGRGFLVHNTLALRVARWDRHQVPTVTVLGLAGQQCWSRPKTRLKAKQKGKRGRLERARESARWMASLQHWPVAPRGVEWIYVADRESDIYEVFERCEARGADWVIRAAQARALVAEDRSVFAAVAQAPVRGRIGLSLRARAGQPARTMRAELRAMTVTLRAPWRPDGPLAARTLQVVEVREVNPLAGSQPMVWVLLTSLPIRTLAQIKRVVGCYTQRWLVEEFHKAIKSGTQVEASQLRTGRALQALCAVLSLVALRLLESKLYARAFPDEPLGAGQFAAEFLRLLATKVSPQSCGWTQRSVWRGIAQCGGFLGRKGDGEPGWITIWRGWRNLMNMAEGVRLYLNMEGYKCGK
jgi:Transposase DNA-binding/Transposase DDE domain/Transposase Tn5 dimerisation domain